MFFKDWIEIEEELLNSNCKILRYKEIPDARKKIYEKLLKKVINHYSHPKRVTNYLKKEKFSKLENYINKRMPTNPNIAKGDFGEIFGTEHLKQFHNYTFPILKLRYKLKNDKSLECEDIMGFYIENDKITRICVGESKVRSKSDSNVIPDAIHQLEKSYNPNPLLIKFFSDRTYELGNEELGEKIEELMSPKFFEQIKKDNWIFFITSFKPRKYKIETNELDNLVLINMYFEDLNEFITNLYKNCRSYYHED